MKRKLNCDVQSGSLGEQNLISSIQILFRHDEKLLSFLFQHQKHRLRLPPKALLREARALSADEQILIRVALDLWSESGDTLLPVLIYTLEHENIVAYVRAILRFREIDVDSILFREDLCLD